MITDTSTHLTQEQIKLLKLLHEKERIGLSDATVELFGEGGYIGQMKNLVASLRRYEIVLMVKDVIRFTPYGEDFYNRKFGNQGEFS